MAGRWLRALGRRRLSESDRLRQEAFLDDIERGWAPPDRGGLLAVRSAIVHVGVRLFSGGPTFASVAVAAAIAAAGSACFTIAPPLHNHAWGGDLPVWVNAALTIGLIGLGFEAGRSPRHVYPRRFVAVGAAPLTASTLFAAMTLHTALSVDWLLRGGFAIATVGVGVTGFAAVLKSSSLFRLGLISSGFAALTLGLNNAAWVPLYLSDHDRVWAIGAVLTSIGCALLAGAFFRARPGLEAERLRSAASSSLSNGLRRKGLRA